MARIDSTIHELMQEAWTTADEKGWHTLDKRIGEEIALMHSELSEALEDIRKGVPVDSIYYEGDYDDDAYTPKPCGVASEFADVLIRIFDTCVQFNIPLEEALVAKMEYNKTRPHLHGGKKL